MPAVLRRHSPGSVKVHLKYGRLTLDDVKAAVDEVDAKGKMQWKKWATNDLQKLHKQVGQELKRRGCVMK